MPTDLETPPAETKPNFLQNFAASRPKNEAELRAANAPDAPPAPAAPPAQPAQPPAAPATPPPAKPVAAAPPATDPDDEIISGKRSPKSEDFRRVKTRATEAQKLADELRGKLAELEKQKPSKLYDEKISKLEVELKSLAEYKTKWEGVAAQFDPAFQTKYQTKVDSVIGAVKPLLPQDKAENIAAVLQMADSPYKIENLKALTEDLDQITVSEITAANREVRGIFAERKAELEKSGEILNKAHEERQKQSREAAERSGKAFEETFKKFTEGESAIPVFQKREDDKEWNKGVEERERVARVIFNGEFESDSDKAEAAAWSAAAPGILAWAKNSIAAKDAELAEAKATIERLQGSSPAINGGKPADAGGQKTTFLDRMRQNSIQ